MYMLCESESGYLFSFIIYTGKGTLITDKYNDMPMTAQIVLTLAEDLLDMGYCITTDNYYTSPQLADCLVSRQTDTYGTLRSTRKDLPPGLGTKKTAKGDCLAYQRGKVMVLKWHDKKYVHLLSTVHNPEQVVTTKKNKEGNSIKKPKVVVDYNYTMGGVDRLDQHLRNYQIAKTRGKKYYKKIFFHLLDLAVFNSFVLYQKNGGRMSNLDYRTELVEQMIRKYHSSTIPKKRGRPNQIGALRLTERHFPDFVPSTEKKSVRYRRCAVCSQKRVRGKKIRKETRYWCSECKVALCVVSCFKRYHTKLDF
ncbi:DDE Tnp 1-like zinc-ribbon [Popillia japonica]|uniref:DDE Tnp 1-like zinc-ribbon n=1 Tax=Popillia japonica TaxID=7064 RepID=A0AAW1HW01_POPJA